jgi:hypothetical protein
VVPPLYLEGWLILGGRSALLERPSETRSDGKGLSGAALRLRACPVDQNPFPPVFIEGRTVSKASRYGMSLHAQGWPEHVGRFRRTIILSREALQ